MNYLPFAFVKAIHDEKIERRLTTQRQHNDRVKSRPALLPDPIGLLFAHIHDAIDRGLDRSIEAISHAVQARQAAGPHTLTVTQKPQALASPVAKQPPTKAVPDETEKTNVTGYLSSRIYA